MVGDVVVYRAVGGAAASGLVSGGSYYITSVKDNGNGTASVTLAASKGGAALNVTLSNNVTHMLSLKTVRSAATATPNADGSVALSSYAGLYDGAAVRFNGSGSTADNEICWPGPPSMCA